MKIKKYLLVIVGLFLLCSITSLNALDIYGVYVLDGDSLLYDYLHIHPNGVIMNEGGYDYVTLTVYGYIINEGTITNNGAGGSLTIKARGNVTNDGTWDCIATYLDGSEFQHISCLNAHSFQSPNFYNNNVTNIIADNDIYFSGANIQWQNNGLLDLSAGYHLHIDQGYLSQAEVISGNGSAINMSGDAYIQDVQIENAELQGICQIFYDNVVFNGTTTVTGTLQNKYNYGQSYTLTINGDIVNNGTICNNGNPFYLDLAGDLTNNGIWQNYDIELTGTSDQHISCPTDSSFALSYFRGNSSRGNIYFDTDIEFVGTEIDLNNDNLILQTGNTLILTGGNLRNGTVTSNNAVLNMTDDAYLNNVQIENAELQGICQILYDTVVFNGITTVTGTLRNKYNYGQSYTLTINGDIVNNGTITNYSGQSLLIDLTGNITNNGIWQNYDIELTGTDQHISCPTDSSFAISYFRGNSSRGNIYFDTDIEFTGTQIDLNSDNLILQAGNTLTLIDGRITDGTVTATNAVLNMSGDADLYDVEIENVELQGICQVSDNNVVLNGTTTVNGILQNKHSYQTTYTLTVNGVIINNGTIRNSSTSSYLSLDISGDIVNNGLWQNTDIEPIGISDQHISCSAGSSFAISYFYGNIFGGNVTLISDVEFVGTNIDLNSDNLNLQEGNMLTLTGGYLQDGTVTANNAVLNMTGDAYLQDVEVENAELQGTCQINGNSVTFNGTTTVTGILQNKHSYATAFTLTANGDIINNGTIKDAYSSSYLFLDITEDIISNGSWSNYRTSFTGTTDQTILLENSNFLTGDVRFVSDVTGSSYQWNFNSVPLNSPDFAGETTVELDWNVPVSDDYAGTFNCDVGRTLSRNIIVAIPPPDAPQNVIISITGSNVEINWTAVTEATSYTVYSDLNPYGNFGTIEYTGADSSCSLPITGDNKFYRVTANN